MHSQDRRVQEHGLVQGNIVEWYIGLPAAQENAKGWLCQGRESSGLHLATPHHITTWVGLQSPTCCCPNLCWDPVHRKLAVLGKCSLFSMWQTMRKCHQLHLYGNVFLGNLWMTGSSLSPANKDLWRSISSSSSWVDFRHIKWALAQAQSPGACHNCLFLLLNKLKLLVSESWTSGAPAGGGLSHEGAYTNKQESIVRCWAIGPWVHVLSLL